jgi:hypothetical protein
MKKTRPIRVTPYVAKKESAVSKRISQTTTATTDNEFDLSTGFRPITA